MHVSCVACFVLCCAVFVLALHPPGKCNCNSIADPFLTPGNATPSIHARVSTTVLRCSSSLLPTAARSALHRLSLAPRPVPDNFRFRPSGLRISTTCTSAAAPAAASVRSSNCQPAGHRPMRRERHARRHFWSCEAEAEQLWERGGKGQS
jgi:hypothetical protein